MKRWTAKEIEQVAELYKKYPENVVAMVTGNTRAQIAALVNNRKILSGRSGKFQKGIIPWNKGKKGITSGGIHTQFKPGHLPHNTKNDGYESIRMDKRGVPYRYIRDGRMQPKHRYIWQLLHGPVTAGHCVAFRDGNTLNCEPDNLMLISRAENAIRNINRKKASETLTILYRREKIRKLYGLPPITKLHKRLVNY
jgi:hypothetical protein